MNNQSWKNGDTISKECSPMLPELLSSRNFSVGRFLAICLRKIVFGTILSFGSSQMKEMSYCFREIILEMKSHLYIRPMKVLWVQKNLAK